MIQRFLVPIFTFIWWNRLKRDDNPYKRTSVYKVVGWRSAVVDDQGYGRITVTYCFETLFKK